MSQRLILPINQARLTASWKTEAYQKRFGFPHYGVDLVSARGNTLVYASGSGEVLAAGFDSLLGNSLVIRYDSAEAEDGRSWELICRMFHFGLLLVEEGWAVNKDTPLGYYGATRKYCLGAHLHLELDRDTRHPFHTPTLSGRSTFFRGSSLGATCETMENPIGWLFCKASPPDRQSYQTAEDSFIRMEDRRIPRLP